MKAIELIELIEKELNVSFYAGVPDSLLSPFTGEIMNKYGVSEKHVIAANEGNALGLAAGYHLATANIPCVYMQNSGQGNIVNPFASLMAPEVYRMPCVFIVGWRGEPGVKDEPQHVFQGKITKSLMDLLEIQNYVVTAETKREDLESCISNYVDLLNNGKCVAFIIEKGALTSDIKPKYSNEYIVSREDAIKVIVENAGDVPIVSTTGKASRELFEIREQKGMDHSKDFLTVGSMGHSSSIALAVAMQKKDTRVWCIDGDGALLMHMGSLALVGANKLENMVHVLLNNESHETVGGMPTVAGSIDILKIAEGCGYQHLYQVDSIDSLEKTIKKINTEKGLTFLEIRVALGARSDLGRPTTTAVENKNSFMDYLRMI